MVLRKPKGYSAWLVTWEWFGEHAKREEKIAAILNPRWAGERVAEYVEFLYAESEYTLEERARFVLTKAKNPYPARFGSLRGVRWTGQVFCGHNPWLFARLVDNLTIQGDETGREQAAWNERPKPDLTRLPGLDATSRNRRDD